jgi:hypothetical protein
VDAAKVILQRGLDGLGIYVTFSPVNPYGYNGGFSSSRMELPASRAD